MFFWNSLAFSMIQWMLAIWSLVLDRDKKSLIYLLVISGNFNFKLHLKPHSLVNWFFYLTQFSSKTYSNLKYFNIKFYCIIIYNVIFWRWTIKILRVLFKHILRVLLTLQWIIVGLRSSRASQMAQLIKNLPANAGDTKDPCIGKVPQRRKWQPTPVFLVGKFPGQRNLVVLQSMGSQRTGHDWVCTHIHTHTHTGHQTMVYWILFYRCKFPKVSIFIAYLL